MTPLGLGIGSSPVHAQSNGLFFRYAPGITVASLGGTSARTSSASYIDQNGVLQTAAPGVIREWAHYIGGVPTTLLEPAATNSFLNSGAPATHTSPSLGVGTYTLWLVGTGSIAVAAGTATITGAGTATSAAPVTFTVTVAGTVTFTVTGAPTRAQCESGAFATSYIATAGAAVARTADTVSIPWASIPQPHTLYMSLVESGTLSINGTGYFEMGGPFPYFLLWNNAGLVRASHRNSTVQRDGDLGTGLPTIGQTAELRAILNADGSVRAAVSVNGGAEQLGVQTAANTLAPAWGSLVIRPNAGSVVGVGCTAIKSIKIALGIRDLATMRAA